MTHQAAASAGSRSHPANSKSQVGSQPGPDSMPAWQAMHAQPSLAPRSAVIRTVLSPLLLHVHAVLTSNILTTTARCPASVMPLAGRRF
jgi:hypothetical protein